MLYLEDYLEMIEHLPQELKDRFTELRELDLQVQNSSDKLDDRVRQFFNNARRAKLPDRESEFDNIRKEYNKVLEDADEKVHQATDMYNLVERYLKRLDQELHKFKLELEADNAGITEVIEKRFIELDQMSMERKEAQLMQSHKENRLQPPMTIKQEKKDRKPSTDKPGTSGGGRIGSGGLMGAGGNAIAAAVHQAIAATTLQQVGRRTPSLKASYDLFNMGLNKEFNYGNKDGLLANTELQQAAQQALAATTGATCAIAGSSDPKKNKRKQPVVPHEPSMSSADEIMGEPVLQTTLTPDWTYDPSEPLYCLCHQVSYGEMVACDNESCPIEWFHYGCVGIKSTPVGKWYCPECSSSMKRKKKRQ